MAIQCPYCHVAKSKVQETRRVGECVWRRLRCGACGLRFVSREEASGYLKMPEVVGRVKRLPWKQHEAAGGGPLVTEKRDPLLDTTTWKQKIEVGAP